MGLLSILPDWRYPRPYSPKDIEGEAVVIDEIYPGRKGGVKFRGTWWSARCAQAIVLAPGTFVRVIGRQRITLLVEPVSTFSPSS